MSASSSKRPRGRRAGRPVVAIGRVAAPLLVLVLLTILPPGAAAAPSQDPAVDQYVESVPSAGGDRAPNNERRSGGGDLPAGVERELQSAGGDDAEDLEAVATSPALGAPKAGGGGAKAAGSGKVGSAAESSGGPSSAVDAVTSAASSGGGGAGGWLLAGLVVLTVALAGTALLRRRSLIR